MKHHHRSVATRVLARISGVPTLIAERLRTSYVVVPLAASVLGAALGYVSLRLDEWTPDLAAHTSIPIFDGTSDSARVVISTFIGTLITIIGCVFSLTVLSLTVASSQFGPRLVRTFMRDTTTQLAIGCFLASLANLVTVLVGMDAARVPHVSVTIAVAMTSLSVAVLVYFVHHVASFLRVPSVLSAIETRFDAIVASTLGEDRDDEEVATRGAAQPMLVRAARDGYVQFVDHDVLVRVARERGLLVHVRVRAGHHVLRGTPIVECGPVTDDDELASMLRDAVLLGAERTDAQDLEHPVRQIVEIALRALSPGINDPFTATACVDRLGALLGRVADRPLPAVVMRHRDDDSQVTTVGTTFEGLMDLAFDQIRQAGRAVPAVTIRALETLAELRATWDDDARRAAVAERHAERLRADRLADTLHDHDVGAIEHAYRSVVERA